MKLIIGRNHPAALVLSTLLVSLAMAPAFSTDRITTISFPSNGVGKLNVVYPAAEPEYDRTGAKNLLAIGQFKIPTGCMIDLTLNFNGSQNTKFIRQIPSSAVRSVTCKDLEIDDKAVADICTLRDLVDLNLQGTDLSDEGMKYLSPLTKMRKLNVSDTLVTEKGLEVLQNMPLITHLNLSRDTLGESVTKHLRPLKNLRALDICGTQLKDKYVEKLPRLDNLTTLVLRRNNITDYCIPSLLKYRNLVTLDVTDTWITFQGLKQLKVLPRLRRLIIRRKSLKSGEREQLSGLMPNLKFDEGSREKVVPKELFAPLH